MAGVMTSGTVKSLEMQQWEIRSELRSGDVFRR